MAVSPSGNCPQEFAIMEVKSLHELFCSALTFLFYTYPFCPYLLVYYLNLLFSGFSRSVLPIFLVFYWLTRFS